MPASSDQHDMLFEEIHSFVTAMLEGDTTAQQVEDFEQQVGRDPAAMRVYREYMTELVGLHWLTQDHGMPSRPERAEALGQAEAFDLAALASLDDRTPGLHLVDLTERLAAERVMRDRPQHTKTPKTMGYDGPRVVVIPRVVVYLATAAAVLIVCMVGYQVFKPATPVPTRQADNTQAAPQDTQAPAPTPAPPPVLAHAGKSLDAAWSVGPQTTDGGAMIAGTYHLDEGLAEIEMAGGSRVVLEGPASFELLSASRLRLVSGRVVGHCPEGSEGLTVLAEQTRVVDLGTAFGVALLPGKDLAVQVYQGEVMVATLKDDGVDASPAGDGAHRLVAGQAVEVRSGTGQLRSIVFDRAAYATEASAQARAMRAYAAGVMDASPLCYWRLDSKGGMGRLANEVAGQPGLRVLGEPGWGAEGGRGWLRFDGVPDGPVNGLFTDDALADLTGEVELTVEAWVRPIRYHRGIIFNFFDPVQPRQPRFGGHIAYLEFVGDPFTQEGENERNKMSWWVDRLGAVKPAEAISARQYPLQEWMHVVAILRGGEMLLYIDGQQAGRVVVSPSFQMAPSVMFGAMASEIDEPIPAQGRVTRRLAGDLDEIAIYRYAMPPDVIAQHHARMKAVLEAEIQAIFGTNN